jgi:transposase-like protein
MSLRTFLLSLRHVEDLLHELGIDICHETVRFWWYKFGLKPPKSAAGVFQNSAPI